jgi:hypothetical protein
MVNKHCPVNRTNEGAYIEAVVDTLAAVLVTIGIHDMLVIFIDIEVVETIATGARDIRLWIILVA